MRGTDARARARARRRTAIHALLAAVVLALAPAVWLSYDLMLRVVYLLAVGVVGTAIVREELGRRFGDAAPARESDDVVPLAAVLDWARPQALPITVVPGAGHFFHGQLTLLRSILVGAWH